MLFHCLTSGCCYIGRFLKGAAGWMSKKNTLKRGKVYSELSVIRIVREIIFSPSIHTCDMCSLKVMTYRILRVPLIPYRDKSSMLWWAFCLYFSFNLSSEWRSLRSNIFVGTEWIQRHSLMLYLGQQEVYGQNCTNPHCEKSVDDYVYRIKNKDVLKPKQVHATTDATISFPFRAILISKVGYVLAFTAVFFSQFHLQQM